MNSPSSLDAFCSWLKLTPLSVELQTVAWIVPAVQSVHILAIAAVISSALMITLRTLSFTAKDQPWSAVASRFLPVIWVALPILLATGTILIVAEPARSLENPAFAWKMGLLGAQLGLIGFSTAIAKRKGESWEASPRVRRIAKPLAIVFLSLWVAIIFAGRWIAYVEAS